MFASPLALVLSAGRIGANDAQRQPGDAPPHAPRILVVDDEENIRRVVSHLLRLRLKHRGGVEVLAAGSAEDALSLLEREGPVDLVLTDYRMPGRTGADLLTAMRERYPETVRVLMTGYQDVWDDEPKMRAAGAAVVIAKPWDNNALFDTLYRLLHREGGGPQHQP